MTDPSPLLVPVTAAALLEVFGVVLGVMMALTGAAVALMGLLAVVDRFVRRGALGMLAGLALVAGGLWLMGVW